MADAFVAQCTKKFVGAQTDLHVIQFSEFRREFDFAKIAPYAAGKRYVGTDGSKTRLFPREGAKYIGEVQA